MDVAVRNAVVGTGKIVIIVHIVFLAVFTTGQPPFG
jgi:hypothetical protein